MNMAKTKQNKTTDKHQTQQNKTDVLVSRDS